jgi:threonine synthase
LLHISTRGEAPPLSFADALLAGLARDGGLYVPESWPTLGRDTIAGFAGRRYADVAKSVLVPLSAGDIAAGGIAAGALEGMIEEAYATFRHPAVCPLVQLDDGLFVQELFHGPTLAFKDVAMQLLGRLMDHVLEARGRRATVVGATSGDTGSAAIAAFEGSERVDVFILYPHGRVSDVQRRQMTTRNAPNIRAVAVEGTFDDCQALVKAMFTHAAFRDDLQLSGVNSINWARVAAQTVYYFTAAAALGAPHRPVSFAVPTGNFGDVLAGWVARRMGLPIADLLVATNANDILARAIGTGQYEIRSVVATSSPSMDIQISSNFERLLFEAHGRDAGAVRNLMGSLKQSGSFQVSPEPWRRYVARSRPRRSTSPKSMTRSPEPGVRPATCSIPIPRSRPRRPVDVSPTPALPTESAPPSERARLLWRSRRRTRPSSPTRSRKRPGSAPSCRPTSPI